MGRQFKAHILTSEILVLQEQLRGVQEKCQHPAKFRTYTPKSNTGNYDPHDDRYWYEYKCGRCLKWWTEPQAGRAVGVRSVEREVKS